MSQLAARSSWNTGLDGRLGYAQSSLSTLRAVLSSSAQARSTSASGTGLAAIRNPAGMTAWSSSPARATRRCQPSAADRRVREAAISPKGKAMTDLVDQARERLGREIFASWDEREFEELVRLMRKFADAFADLPTAGDSD